jgi:hypothetical protein
MSTKTRATIEDLYKVEGKAELVNGEIVELPPAGEDPGAAGFEIAVSLREYARRTGQGTGANGPQGGPSGHGGDGAVTSLGPHWFGAYSPLLSRQIEMVQACHIGAGNLLPLRLRDTG